MSSPVDIEVTGDDEVPAWMADNDVELQKIPSSAANNNHNGNIIRAPTPSSSAVNNTNTNTNTNNSSNNNTRNGEVLPDWSIEDGHPVAIGVPVSPVIVDRNISTSAPTTAAMTTTTTNLSINNNNNTTSTSNADIASKKTWKKYCQEIFERDGRLLMITLIILICMNIPIVKWVLYPFTIFSTWIHEVCHGFAALIVGGSISKIMIYPDTSGLAYTSANPARRGFIASAGYQGTAVIGCLLLLFRRTKRGPRTGTMIVAVMMVLSCCLWIRNLFGFVFIFCSGLLLIGVSLKLPSNYMRDVYVVLAVTCSLNAITSVHDLFGNTNVVNGDASQSSDAHTMSEVVGGSYILWALLWLLLALLLTLIQRRHHLNRDSTYESRRRTGKPPDSTCSTVHYRLPEYCAQLATTKTNARTEPDYDLSSFNDYDRLLLFLSMVRSMGWRARYVVALEPIARDLDVDHPLFHSESNATVVQKICRYLTMTTMTAAASSTIPNVTTGGEKSSPIIIDDDDDDNSNNGARNK